NAWDHRSDAYSSIGVLIGISGAKLGYPLLDPIAAGIVAIFIFKAGFDIIRDAFHDLMDRALPATTVERIRTLAKEVKGVIAVGDVRGRRMGSKVIADVRITVGGFATAKEGHNIAREVERRLMEKIRHLAEVIIHVDVEEMASDVKQAQFKKRTQNILAKHSDLFLEVHELDYHFSEQGKEVHFHLVVPRNTTFETAHKLSRHLEKEIRQEFPESTVVVHLEPASQKKGKNVLSSGWYCSIKNKTTNGH
ncbi:MAG: cation diffusion facilitator family transporter, partial [bacterium]